MERPRRSPLTAPWWTRAGWGSDDTASISWTRLPDIYGPTRYVRRIADASGLIIFGAAGTRQLVMSF